MKIKDLTNPPVRVNENWKTCIELVKKNQKSNALTNFVELFDHFQPRTVISAGSGVCFIAPTENKGLIPVMEPVNLRFESKGDLHSMAFINKNKQTLCSAKMDISGEMPKVEIIDHTARVESNFFIRKGSIYKFKSADCKLKTKDTSPLIKL